MEEHPNNPKSNKLGAGITEDFVKEAVSKSGYPLQTVIANLLAEQEFGVQEEWSYINPDSNRDRTIDIMAQRDFFELGPDQPRVRPTLNLLFECKQSDLPFVFFLSSTPPTSTHFPLLAGLFSDEVELTSDDDPSTHTFGIVDTLGLGWHPFLQNVSLSCTSFSKCVRKGANVELSGSDPFNGLVLPLLKSLHHFKTARTPQTAPWYSDLHLVLGVGVLDAPMVGVTVSGDSNELTLVPWVRVIRHESYEGPNWWERTRLLAIDIVHRDFFEQYVRGHALPFAETFSELAIKHQSVLATGKGFASGLMTGGIDKIEQTLQPRTKGRTVTRYGLIVQAVLRFLLRRKSTPD